ncbi:MAG: hypothetical protein QXF26_07555 [Candidatus Bathyarchaeia archaeon]
MGRPWGLMTAGIVLASCGLLYITAYLGYIRYSEAPSICAIVLGVWLVIEGIVKALRPIRGEMESAATVGWGVLIAGIGVVGDLNVRGYPLTVLLAAYACLIGVLAIIAALRMSKEKNPATEKIKQQGSLNTMFYVMPRNHWR